MKKKAQSLVFEQVLLFSVAIVILMASFALFSMYQGYYMRETMRDQLVQDRSGADKQVGFDRKH